MLESFLSVCKTWTQLYQTEISLVLLLLASLTFLWIWKSKHALSWICIPFLYTSLFGMWVCWRTFVLVRHDAQDVLPLSIESMQRVWLAYVAYHLLVFGVYATRFAPQPWKRTVCTRRQALFPLCVMIGVVWIFTSPSVAFPTLARLCLCVWCQGMAYDAMDLLFDVGCFRQWWKTRFGRLMLTWINLASVLHFLLYVVPWNLSLETIGQNKMLCSFLFVWILQRLALFLMYFAPSSLLFEDGGCSSSSSSSSSVLAVDSSEGFGNEESSSLGSGHAEAFSNKGHQSPRSKLPSLVSFFQEFLHLNPSHTKPDVVAEPLVYDTVELPPHMIEEILAPVQSSDLFQKELQRSARQRASYKTAF